MKRHIVVRIRTSLGGHWVSDWRGRDISGTYISLSGALGHAAREGRIIVVSPETRHHLWLEAAGLTRQEREVGVR